MKHNLTSRSAYQGNGSPIGIEPTPRAPGPGKGQVYPFGDTLNLFPITMEKPTPENKTMYE